MADRLREATERPEVLFRADELAVAPIVLIIAALAYRDRHRSRTAARIARRVFGAAPPAWIDALEALVASLMDENMFAGA